MKILACASFDYMKLMVVELQHQLAELEEAEERAAAAHAAEATEATEATADGAGGGGEPRPPPRQRANPFNNQVRLGASSYYLITFVVFSSPLPPCLQATSLSKLWCHICLWVHSSFPPYENVLNGSPLIMRAK